MRTSPTARYRSRTRSRPRSRCCRPGTCSRSTGMGEPPARVRCCGSRTSRSTSVRPGRAMRSRPLARRHGVEPHFLTVGFADSRFDEAAVAGATALRLGGAHHVVPLAAGDVLALLPDALAAMDQPTADGVNTYVITRAAAEFGIKVLVSGLGGDELFGGYTTFRKAPFLAAHARRLAPFARLLGGLGVGNVTQWAKIAGARDVGDLRTAYLLQRALGADVPDDGRCGLPADTWDGLAGRGSQSKFRAVSALEVGFYLRSQLLHDADVFS